MNESYESEISQILESLFTAADGDAWLKEPHVLLGGERPIDLIQSGQHRRVLTVLRQITDGAYL